MSNHLARRGSLWWARLVVPAHLRKQAGRREFSQSTQTHELHIAKLVGAVLVATWRRQLMALESVAMSVDVLKVIDKSPELTSGGHLSLADAAAMIGVELILLLREAANGDLKLHCRLSSMSGFVLPRSDLERDESISGGVARVVPIPTDMPESAIDTVLSGVLPISDSRHVANAIISEGLKSIDVVLFDLVERPDDVFAPAQTVWCEIAILEVEADQVDVIRLKLKRDFTPEQIKRAEEVHIATLRPRQDHSRQRADMLFSEALDAYCNDASGLPRNLTSPSEQKQRKKGCLLFAEFMGDLPLSEIDAEKLRAFRDGPLRTLPAKVNNLPKSLSRPTMKQMVEALRAGAIDWPLMSFDMQRERMLWLGRFFAWLKSKEWIKDNPAAYLQGETGLTKAERKNINRKIDDDQVRGPFSQEELLLIFGQSWFDTGSGVHFKKPRKWYPFEYWLPLLGLYAGCRIGEASQLHLSDIKPLGVDAWYLDINEGTKDKSLKNAQSKRTIPVHQALIDLGFIAYCERLKVEGFKRVFPELTFATSDARYAKEPIRKMSDMLKGLHMPRDGMHVFHCLRHNMNNELTRVPMDALPFADENLRKFIRCTVLGHKPGDDVNVKHYTSTTLEEMLALIRGLSYELPQISKLDIDFAISQIYVSLASKQGQRSDREDMGPLNEEVYGSK